MTNKAKHQNTCLFLLKLAVCAVQHLFLTASPHQSTSLVFVLQRFTTSQVFKH